MFQDLIPRQRRLSHENTDANRVKDIVLGHHSNIMPRFVVSRSIIFFFEGITFRDLSCGIEFFCVGIESS